MGWDMESLNKIVADNPDVTIDASATVAKCDEPDVSEMKTGSNDRDDFLASVGTEQIKLILPYPPSANRYWRSANNRVYLSREARDYKKLIGAIVGTPINGDARIDIDVYRPRKSGDLDNRLKVVLDALQGVAYHDDSQIVEIHARRFDDKRNPRVEIVARNIG